MKKGRPWITKEERVRLKLLRIDLVSLANRTQDPNRRSELETNIRTIDRELDFDNKDKNDRD